jgi:hypothetical protein
MPGPLAISPNGANALLGRGKVFMDRLLVDNTGALVRTGEFDIGNVTSFELTPTTEVKELYESMDPASELYARAITRLSFGIKIVGNEFSLFNVANNLCGDQAAVTSSVVVVASQTLTTSPKAGAYYGLGDNVRNATAVVVKNAATVLVEGTDYRYEASTGRVQLLAGSTAYTPADTLTVGYSTAAYTLNRVILGASPQIDAFVRFVGNPVKGPKLDGLFWHVQFTPSGALGFIADDYGNWTLDGKVIADNLGHPDDPNGIVEQTGFA